MNHAIPKIVNIFGYALSGKAAELLATHLGSSVFVYDDKIYPDKKFINHDIALDQILNIVSPGIPSSSKILLEAQCSQGEFISELEFGYRYCSCPVIAITGTNGKTTTTELTAHIINGLGLNVTTAGNIGIPLTTVAIDSKKYDFIIVEVSSFQLEKIKYFNPFAASLLNIASDHLDRYDSFSHYSDTKFKIFDNMDAGSLKLLNLDIIGECSSNKSEFTTFSAYRHGADCSFDDKFIYFKGDLILDFGCSNLIGNHNVENMMAALVLSIKAYQAVKGRDPKREVLEKVISKFKADRHRLEVVLKNDEVMFVNDSKSTNPDSVVAAVKALEDEGRILLILGGLDKNMDFSHILKIGDSVKKSYLMGECQEKIALAISSEIDSELYKSFNSAVKAAIHDVKPGDIVLLSPGCASMDMFKNYKERGERFCDIVLDSV